MSYNGIRTFYKGDLGEIRYSEFHRLHKDFREKNTLSFKYVLQGQENYIVDGKHFRLEERQALFFREDKHYQGIIDYPEVTQGLCIDLNLDMVAHSVRDEFNERETFFFNPEFRTQKVAFLATETHVILHKMAQGSAAEHILSLEEYMQDLMYRVVLLEHEFVTKIRALPPKKTAYKKELFKRLLDAKNFIQDAKYQNIKLKDIAQAANLSSFYLHRLFRQVFGCSPAAYLEHIRMQEAQEKLRQKLSVKETAYALGYSDDAYFCRRFKKYFGITPKQFVQAV